MDVVEEQRGQYTISTDKTRLDLGVVHSFLRDSSYWAQDRPFSVVEESIEHSLCFGVYAGTEQVGFARVVTDYATFAWVCDVFVLEPHRRQGLGRWLTERIVSHPNLRDVGLFTLATRDAHELYRRYGGFQELPMPEKWMVRRTTRAPAGQQGDS